MGRFKKGIFLGGLFGAGLMWLNTTKKGRGMRDQMLDHAADIYGDVKDKAMGSKHWDTMTKNQYIKMVQDTVNKYAVENGMADNVKRMVTKIVSAQWSKLKAEKGKK